MCSSMTFRTAALSAISARTCSGNLRMSGDGLVISLISFNQHGVCLRINYMKTTLAFHSNNRRYVLRVIKQRPRISQWAIVDKKIPKRALKSPTDINLRHIVAAFGDSISDSGKRQINPRHPQEKEVYPVALIF